MIYYQRPSFTLLQGDVRECLASLPDDSVHCVVTSPPYWGLRSYGTEPQIWPDGRALCETHEWADATVRRVYSDKTQHSANSILGAAKAQDGRINASQGDTCARCGAWRGELGLEPTPALFVKHIVEVFREVRRVLRPDGTCWVNLGSSYASGGMNANQSRPSRNEPAYGSDDTEQLDSQAPGLSCHHSGDEYQGDYPNHQSHNVHTSQEPGVGGEHLCKIDHDTEPMDYVQASPPASAGDVPASTILSLFGNEQGAYNQQGEPVASGTPMRVDATQETVHMAGHNSCKPLPSDSSVDRKQDKALSSRALSTPTSTLYNSSMPYPDVQFKPKDLIPIPWMVAMALQTDGWWLRQDIIWSKPNPMPESVTDRCTKSHEYIFLLTKSARYFWDQEAVREEPKPEYAGKSISLAPKRDGDLRNDGGNSFVADGLKGRNLRSVWNIATQPFADAHFATYPQALVERCIKAGCPADGTVLDPFLGSGTTALVANRMGRKAIGVELKSEYAEMAVNRLQQEVLI